MVPFYSIFPRRSAVNADFFFSSRRRHTRYIGDCSSDVCSSDLDAATNQVDSQRKHSARESSADSGRKLSEVFEGVETALPADASSLEIHQVACDSRKVRPGALFFALQGAKADGNKFIQDALKRGAVAIAGEEQTPGTIPAGVVRIQVREARKALRSEERRVGKECRAGGEADHEERKEVGK